MASRRKSKITKDLTKFVIFSFVCLIAYTIVSIILFAFKGVEMSTLTTCFYAASGGEVLMCALIKIFKLKGESDGNSNSQTDI